MRRGTWAALAALFVCGNAWAQGSRYTGQVIRSTAAIGGASVRVCTEAATGTPCTPLASIYSDKALTVLDADSIIAADSQGNYGYWAAPGCYKEQISGAGFGSYTQTVCQGPQSIQTNTQTVIFSATPTFNLNNGSLIRMTLTGNVTSSSVSNASTGSIAYFNICQDATGNRTFAWPTSFLTPPSVGTAASSCTSASFIYDGTNWRELAPSSRGSATFDTVTVSSAAATGGLLALKSSDADGITQFLFYPENGASQDVGIVVHKCASGTGPSCAGANLHRHFTLYTSPSIGAAPEARLVADYGVATTTFLFSRSKIDFDLSAAPGSGGGFFERVVLGNNKFVESWNAAGTNIPPLIGANSGNVVEVGATSIWQGINFYPGASTIALGLTSAGVATYKGVATVASGIPAEYAQVNLTAQGAAIGATTLYAVPAAGAGQYRVCFNMKLTQAATTSSVLGGTNGFQLVYTDQDDSVVVTTVAGLAFNSTVANLALNTTQAQTNGCLLVNAKASTNIQYQVDYTSVGATPMQFNLHIRLEAM